VPNHAQSRKGGGGASRTGLTAFSSLLHWRPFNGALFGGPARRANGPRGTDRGATLVEAAIAYSLLFLTLFGVVEFGMAFKDLLSVGHASRQGARAGATFGTAPETDILVLREVQGVLATTGLPIGTEVRVYEAAPAGLSTTYDYGPGTGCGSTVFPALSGCCDWTPCPEPGRTTYIEPLWPPPTRDVEAPGTDRLGVEIVFTHNWLTGLVADSTDFTTTTDFQLEPEVFAPAP